MILDEATSALDNLSESEIKESINKIKSMYNTTVIMIAHRLSTIQNADKIFVLNSFRVIEDFGTFEELQIKENELFKTMMILI